ncbi:MAG: ribonuclease Z [Candidatus Omnitrophota bacterium]
MAKIFFLGTSAAIASSKRDNTSILLSHGKDRVLIDTPGSLLVKLARLKVDYRAINHIILTHSHPDHIYGLVSLLHSRYQLDDQINIFAHPTAIKLVKQLRRLFKLENTDKYPKIIYKKVEAGLFYDSGNISVRAFKVKHSRDSLGLKFFFKKDRVNLVYSSDTAKSRDLIRVSRGCDYLIHDCFAPQRIFKKYPQLISMHTSSLGLGKIAREINPRVLIPIHFTSEVKYSLEAIRKEIKKNFAGRIILPVDFDILKLA